jgi:hypothetical protein
MNLDPRLRGDERKFVGSCILQECWLAPKPHVEIEAQAGKGFG